MRSGTRRRATWRLKTADARRRFLQRWTLVIRLRIVTEVAAVCGDIGDMASNRVVRGVKGALHDAQIEQAYVSPEALILPGFIQGKGA